MGQGRDRSRRQPLHVCLDEGRLMGRERERHNASSQPTVNRERVVGRETENRRQLGMSEERVNDLYFEAVLRTSKVRGDEFDLRLYDRSGYKFPADAVPKKLLFSDLYICPLVHPVCNSGAMFAFALYADGACSYRNGRAPSKASVGVYGTRDAFYNQGYRLPVHVPQTYDVAKIYSAIAAIKVARAIIEAQRPHLVVCGCAPTVVLLVDSEDIVRAITHYNRKWPRKQFITSHDKAVENAHALHRLDKDIRRLWRQQRHIVRFWKVPPKCVDGARRMAAEALRGSKVYDDTDADFDDMCNDFKASFLHDERLHAGLGGHPGCKFQYSGFPTRMRCAAH